MLSQPPLDPFFVFQKSLEISYLLMASLNVFSLLGINKHFEFPLRMEEKCTCCHSELKAPNSSSLFSFYSYNIFGVADL